MPDLTSVNDMAGSCKIKAILEGVNGTVDTGYTEEFKIENKLNISCEDVDAMPGEVVNIVCTARKFTGELIKSGTAKINYRKEDSSTVINSGMFSFNVGIWEDNPSGTQKMAIEAEDGKGSYGNLIFEINV